MAKRILTLRDVVSADVAAPADIVYEEPPSAYDSFTRPLTPRPEGQRVLVTGVEMGFGRMVSLAMRWVLAYLLAIALVAAIAGAVFLLGTLIFRAVS